MIMSNRLQTVCRIALALAVCWIGGCRNNPSLNVGSTHTKATQPGQPSQTLPTEGALVSHRSTASTVAAVETLQVEPVSHVQFTTQVTQAPELLGTLTEPVDDQVSNQETKATLNSKGQALAEFVNQAIANHPEIRRLRANTREA